jgi:hypothetical protein
MVEQLLSRHDFRLEESGKENRFRTKDKYALLQRFSLHAARLGGFGEFTKAEVIECGQQLFAANIDIRPSHVHSMVEEIINRSGLLTGVADDGVFIMAHRSIHEFLAASELARDGGGIDELIDRVADPEWRQVILIYSSLPNINSYVLLSRIAARTLSLQATVSLWPTWTLPLPMPSLASWPRAFSDGGEVAYLTALFAATRNENLAIRQAATDAVESALTRLADPAGVLRRADVDERVIVNIIDAVIRTGNDEMTALIPRFAALVPNGPRMVAPLWRCLSIPDFDRSVAAAKIVGRLLDLAVDVDCFEELRRQEPLGSQAWLTQQARRKAYPFRKGLPIESNLVTLLAWADHVGAQPTRGNRFTEARLTDPKKFARTESDLSRTIRVPRWLLLAVLKLAVCATPIAIALPRILADPNLLVRPFGSQTLLLISAPMAVGGLAAVLLGSSLSGLMEFLAWLAGLFRLQRLAVRLESAYDSGARVLPSDWFGPLRTPLQYVFYFVLTFSIGVTLAPLMYEDGLWKYSAAAAATMAVATAITLIPGYDSLVYIRRPNPFVDMYEDAGSIHWLRHRPVDIAEQRRQVYPARQRVRS